MSLVKIKKKESYKDSTPHLRFVLRNGKGHPEMRKEAVKHLIFSLIKSGRKKEAKRVINKAKRHMPELNSKEGVRRLLRELLNFLF